MLHDLLLLFFVPFLPFLVLFLLRKRLIRALTRSFLDNGAVAFDTLAFEEVIVDIEGEKVKQKVLTPYFRGFLGQMAPILVTEGMKSIKLKLPANLPVNAAGELDFMAPVLQKLASGKKVKIEDFLPVIMEKAMPYLEGFLGKMATGQKPAGETKNPFL